MSWRGRWKIVPAAMGQESPSVKPRLVGTCEWSTCQTQPQAPCLSSRRMNSGRKRGRRCGGARSLPNGRSHEKTESIPTGLERRSSTAGTRSLRSAVRQRGGGRGRGGVPIHDDDRDEDTGQARPGGQGAIGETSGELTET